MRKFSDDINDNEIRIIGQKKKKKRLMSASLQVLVIAVVFLVLVVAILLYLYKNKTVHPEYGVFEPASNAQFNPHPLCKWIADADTVTTPGTYIKDTVVNDIPIKIYLPLNAKPTLEIGQKCLTDENVILAFQAADIRADNYKIVGAFVLKGKPVAWGLSKKGYCAILRDSVFVGRADNSPLFEEATECEGYFFRQYPLVSNGEVQHSELKSQAIRRALCDVENRIVVVETQTNASMNDFSQLLADIGVDNAIYLIGSSESFYSITDLHGNRQVRNTFPTEGPYPNPSKASLKYINFIYWTASQSH